MSIRSSSLKRTRCCSKPKCGSKFGGIGVRIRQLGDPPVLTIAGPPEPGTPAFRADIRPNDRILAIDGESTDGMTMTDVLRRMRGEPGEPVRLAILHDGDEEPVTIVLVREIITIDSILGDRRRADGSWQFRLDVDPRIAYIRITTFADKTIGELTELVERLEQDGVTALVLDVRDNSGGALDAAVGVSDLFLPADKLIVETRGRDREVRDRYLATGKDESGELPIAVLINRNTASASEIVAACLQDHDRAVVVGERSYGKGTVQQLIPVESGRSRLKLTSASYWRPSGENIHRMPGDTDEQKWGVLPSPGMEIEVSDEDYVAYRKYRSDRDLMATTDSDQASEENNADQAEVAIAC